MTAPPGPATGGPADPQPGDPQPGEARGWPRWTVRLRLTLAYGALFLLTGALLLGISFVLLQRSIEPRRSVRVGAVVSSAGPKVCVLDPSGSTAPTCVPKALADPSAGQAAVPHDLALTGNQVFALRSQVVSTTLRRLLQASLVALGLMALVAFWLGWVVAGRVLRPLQRITATAKRLSERTLHQRIALQGPDDELKELADTFDAMLARLDAAFDSQRRFVANASHELRTPLAITRTEVDVALADPATPAAELRAMAERVREATGRSEQLIEGLLTLARSERELRRRDGADLADAAAEALDLARVAGARDSLRFISALRPAPVSGDRALLERMVANLVENAVRHNQPGGWVDVATGRSDGRAFVRVANGGREIPADQVAALFEPFRRLDGRTGRGAGLGLSIVRSVAVAHGGEATARALAGGGLEVLVRLPARVPALGMAASSRRSA